MSEFYARRAWQVRILGNERSLADQGMMGLFVQVFVDRVRICMQRIENLTGKGARCCRKSNAQDIFIGAAGSPKPIEILLHGGGCVADDLLRVLHHQDFLLLQARMMIIPGDGLELLGGKAVLTKHRSVCEQSEGTAHLHRSGQRCQLVVAQAQMLAN